MSLKPCPICGKPISDKAPQCIHCGNSLICPECSTPITESCTCCPTCGYPIEAQVPDSSTPPPPMESAELSKEPVSAPILENTPEAPPQTAPPMQSFGFGSQSDPTPATAPTPIPESPFPAAPSAPASPQMQSFGFGPQSDPTPATDPTPIPESPFPATPSAPASPQMQSFGLGPQSDPAPATAPTLDSTADNAPYSSLSTTAPRAYLPKKTTGIKGFVTFAVLTVLLSVLSFVTVGYANNSLNAALGSSTSADYLEYVSALNYQMATDVTNAHFINENTKIVWYNYDNRLREPSTDAFTRSQGAWVGSIDSVIANFFADQDIDDTLTNIRDGYDTAYKLAEKIQTPPAGYEKVGQKMQETWSAYLDYLNLTLAPEGTLAQFTSKVEARYSRFERLAVELQQMVVATK